MDQRYEQEALNFRIFDAMIACQARSFRVQTIGSYRLSAEVMRLWRTLRSL